MFYLWIVPGQLATAKAGAQQLPLPAHRCAQSIPASSSLPAGQRRPHSNMSKFLGETQPKKKHPVSEVRKKETGKQERHVETPQGPFLFNISQPCHPEGPLHPTSTAGELHPAPWQRRLSSRAKAVAVGRVPWKSGSSNQRNPKNRCRPKMFYWCVASCACIFDIRDQIATGMPSPAQQSLGAPDGRSGSCRP